MINSYSILIVELKGRARLENLGLRQDSNIKMDLKEIGRDVVDRIYISQNGYH
jgi:hypothetical protein